MKTIGKNNHTLKRGAYFSKFRIERKLLNILSNNPISQNLKSLEGAIASHRQTARMVYYYILPKLLSRLTYKPDFHLAQDIERYYYDLLNIMNCSRGNSGSVNRLNWELRNLNTIERISLSKQSSNEPCISFDPSSIASAHWSAMTRSFSSTMPLQASPSLG